MHFVTIVKTSWLMVFRKIIDFYCLHPVMCYNVGFLTVNRANV
jgi:hypothetical protein